MARSRRPPRAERSTAIRDLLWAVAFAVAAIAVRDNRGALQRLLARAHIHDSLSAHVVSTALIIAVGLATLFAAAGIFHLVEWAHASWQERSLSDDRRSTSIPPLAVHLQVLTTRVGLVASSIFFVAGLALLAVYAAMASHPDLAGLWGVLLSVIGAVSFADARRERRAIALCDTGPDLSARVPRAVAAAGSAPALRFVLFEATETDALPQLALSPDSNVFGASPWNIVYMHVFANERRLSHLLASPWREFGYVQFIRAAASVTGAELRRAREGGQVFIASLAQLETELARHGRHAPLVVDGRPRPFGAPPRPGTKVVFPAHPLLCHTAFWQIALDRLLADADVALLDLSGYQQANRGTAYELQRLIDTFPMRRCVLMLDEYSDLLFLKAHIAHAWRRMALSSPNRDPANGTLLLLVVPEVAAANRRAPHPPGLFSAQQIVVSRAQLLQLGRLLQDVLRSPGPGMAAYRSR